MNPVSSKQITNGETVTAAHSVLSTTELLEQILLRLSIQDEASDQILPPCALQLFTLQRVNQKFNATIRRSLSIRRKMMLAHLDRHDQRRPFGIEYAFNQQECLLPYVHNSYNGRIQDVVNDQSEPQKNGIVHLKGWLFSDDPRTRSLPTDVKCSGVTPSWRDMKLCSHPQIVKMYLHLTIVPGMSYMSMVALDRHMDTLEILDYSVQRVLDRSKDEHIKYMRKHREMSATFNGATIYWRSTRQDLPSMLRTPAVAKLREAQELHSMQENCGRTAGECAFCAMPTGGRFATRMWKDIAAEHTSQVP